MVKRDADGDGCSVLHTAVDMGADGYVAWLLSMGVDVSMLTTRSHRTALMVAAKTDEVSEVKLV